jgi:hypothetical protein
MIWNWLSFSREKKAKASHGSHGFYGYVERLSKLGQLKHADVTERIIGVFYDVYNELRFGFLESVYEASMVIALEQAGLKVSRQTPIPVWFRRQQGWNILCGSYDERPSSCRAQDRENSARSRRLLFDNERKNIRESV